MKEGVAYDVDEIQPAQAVDPLVLAIDVGTSSVRALLYDAKARVVVGCEAHLPYHPRTTPDGGVEIAPEFLLELVGQSVDQVLATVRKTGRTIKSVACDTFWHSLVGVASNESALTPVYTWADTRSREAARSLRQLLDEGEVHARTGAVFHSSYPPAKLRWFQACNPIGWDSVAYWMSFGELLYFRLFGKRVVSISMASGSGLMDQNTCAWDSQILSAISVDRKQLSDILEFSNVVTGLRPPFATRWPVLQNVPWYLPLGDGACNNIGSGGVGDRRAVIMIGTSAALRVVRESEGMDIPQNLWVYRADRRRFVAGGALSDGGNDFAWLADTLRITADPVLEQALQNMAPDCHGLTVLPFLAGERSPHWNVDARSALVGMTLNTSARDVTRAFLEGIAYRCAVVFQSVESIAPEIGCIIGSGSGLIRSPAWMQIICDVLGKPMDTSGVREASSRGAALLALEAMGAVPDLGSMPAPTGKRYFPNEAHHETYKLAIQRQEELYSMLNGPKSSPHSPAGPRAKVPQA